MDAALPSDPGSKSTPLILTGVDQLASPLLRLALAITRSRNASAAKATANLPHDGSLRLHMP